MKSNEQNGNEQKENVRSNSNAEAKAEFDQARRDAQEAYERYLDARKHLMAAALAAGVEFKDSMSGHIEEAVDKVQEQREQLQSTASDYIREKPLQSMAMAVAGGVLLSRLIGR